MLEEILQKYFGCKKPFLKRRKIVGFTSDGQPEFDYLTKKGAKAYEQLVSLIYDLDNILGCSTFDANHYIEILDEIVSSEVY